MNRTRVFTAAIVVGVLTTVGMTGCAPAAPSQEENVTAACAALQTLEMTIDEASADLQQASTVGEVRDIRDRVVTAYDIANAALDEVASDRADAVQEAGEAFTEALGDVDDETEISDARDGLVEEAKSFQDARTAALADLSCE
ncbi:hypothetical protein [Microbacterium sp. Leaf320]|uniref:hypothetical protein n=1 Tax=Microbacterium sp. Leaf320 TaxID=1736334 RepID=UPI0006FD385A|nr:hypothetical protein [Microbacterium sp. Leaf320]KQQ65346.1 hypothetical protein ASF63_15510 [Microbacterium sp. Leaf320]